jgi:AraC family transcriptional activator of pobA
VGRLEETRGSFSADYLACGNDLGFDLTCERKMNNVGAKGENVRESALRNAPASVLSVPAYTLYGEDRTQSIFGFFHIEPFSVRNIPNNWRISPHRHPDFDQLSILLSGKCSFHHDGRNQSVEVPSCVYTPVNVVHEFTYEPDAKGFVISVSSDFASGLPSVEGALSTALLRLSSNRVVLFPSDSATSCVQNLVNQIALSFERSHRYRRDVLLYLFGCLVLEIDGVVLQTPPDATDFRSENASTELFRNFKNLLRSAIEAVGFSEEQRPQMHTVEAFAERLSTTTSALNSACQSVSGASAREMIHLAVLDQATRLLLYSSRPVKEISFLLGYSQASHFARFFKLRRGTTPELFRANFLANPEA